MTGIEEAKTGVFMRKIALIFMVSLSSTLLAADFGSAAAGLFEPVAFLTVMMRYAAYATGIALILGSLMQFRTHIENPKVMPLLTPVFLLLTGILLVLLPYFSVLPGNSWSAEVQVKTGNQGELDEGHTTKTNGAPVDAAPAAHWGDAYITPAPAAGN